MNKILIAAVLILSLAVGFLMWDKYSPKTIVANNKTNFCTKDDISNLKIKLSNVKDLSMISNSVKQDKCLPQDILSNITRYDSYNKKYLELTQEFRKMPTYNELKLRNPDKLDIMFNDKLKSKQNTDPDFKLSENGNPAAYEDLKSSIQTFIDSN